MKKIFSYNDFHQEIIMNNKIKDNIIIIKNQGEENSLQEMTPRIIIIILDISQMKEEATEEQEELEEIVAVVVFIIKGVAEARTQDMVNIPHSNSIIIKTDRKGQEM